MVEQQLKELTRSYQTAQDFYNDLLKKRQNAGVAGDLESQQQSEQFRVYDPPSLPDRPSFPKKVYFAGGGLSGGLALGLALLYLIAIGDKSMHTERDVELALKLPVLALVPVLEALRPSEMAAGSRQERVRRPRQQEIGCRAFSNSPIAAVSDCWYTRVEAHRYYQQRSRRRQDVCGCKSRTVYYPPA